MQNPYSSYRSPEEAAKSLLFHYFQLVSPVLDGDNASEIGQIVDSILAAVEQRTVEWRLKNLEEQVESLDRGLKQANQLLAECHKSIVAAGEAPDEECAQMCITPLTLAEKLAEYFAE